MMAPDDGNDDDFEDDGNYDLREYDVSCAV